MKANKLASGATEPGTLKPLLLLAHALADALGPSAARLHQTLGHRRRKKGAADRCAN